MNPLIPVTLALVSLILSVIAFIVCFTVEERRRKFLLSECKAIREDLEKLKARLKDELTGLADSQAKDEFKREMIRLGLMSVEIGPVPEGWKDQGHSLKIVHNTEPLPKPPTG